MAEPQKAIASDSQDQLQSPDASTLTMNNSKVENREFTVRSTLGLIGAFLALFCTLGFQNAFGVFQEYYARTVLKEHSEFEIAWIGGLLTFLLFFCAAPAGILVDKIGPTPLLSFGSFGVLLGIFMTSLCKEFYQFILAQGILMGSSTAFLLTPAMATVSHMFDRRRGVATGIMIAGSSTGGIIWPIMLDQLLNEDKVSFGWALRYVGFAVLPLCILILLTVRQPPIQGHTHSIDGMIEASTEKEVETKGQVDIVKNPTFLLLCAGLAVATFGLFTPFFFIPSYAVAKGLSTSLAFYLISMLNGASLIGRVTTGVLADKYGNFNLCFLTVASSGIIVMCWTKATSSVGIILFTLAYGYTSGAMFSLQTPCAVQLATPESRGAAIGLLFVAPAIPGLVGTPISGRLIPHGYTALSMYSGACLLAGSSLVLWARLRQSRQLLAKV